MAQRPATPVKKKKFASLKSTAEALRMQKERNRKALEMSKKKTPKTGRRKA